MSEIQEVRSSNSIKEAYKLSFQLLHRIESVEVRSNKTHIILNLLDAYGNFMLTFHHEIHTGNNRLQMNNKKTKVIVESVRQIHWINLSYPIFLNSIQTNKILN